MSEERTKYGTEKDSPADELPKVKGYLGEAAYRAAKYEEGAKLFERITTDDVYVEFLTLPAYAMID